MCYVLLFVFSGTNVSGNFNIKRKEEIIIFLLLFVGDFYWNSLKIKIFPNSVF